MMSKTAGAHAAACLLSLTLAVAPQFATVTLAASKNQCLDRFAAADLNNDGVLSDDEIGNAGFAMPSSLANRTTIPRNEFLSACSKERPSRPS
jgi:hypothetical protein